MLSVEGKFATAAVHVARGRVPVDPHALAQVRMVCGLPASAGSKLVVMPDVHAGAVGPVGLTMTVGERVMPALVGSDVGCGVSAVWVRARRGLELSRLDKVVRACVLGSRAHARLAPAFVEDASHLLDGLRCATHVQRGRALDGFATLGGGNHFVELARASDGALALMVHSGSRILGAQVHDWYMRAGQRELASRGESAPYELAWLAGACRDAYLADVLLTCRFAESSRRAMLWGILRAMGWKPDRRREGDGWVSCIHNYVSADGVLRKGAISAKAGEAVLIPANMRDGTILGVGRGNADWNESAPHGSGRVLRRSDVAGLHTVSEYRREVRDVWTSCVGVATLDEAPFAYRSLEQVRDAIGETVEVRDVLRPLYNFRAKGAKP